MAKSFFYGWLDARNGVFRVSRLPPDAPVRPSQEFDSQSDAATYVERRRGRLMWWPPLPELEPLDRDRDATCTEAKI